MPNKLNVPMLWSAEMGQAYAKQQEIAADAYSTDQSFEDMRIAYKTERAFWNEGGPEMEATRDAEIATAYGPVAVRMYRPVEEETLPVIFYIHGGGWVLGDLDTHDRVCRLIARNAGAAVIAIDYSLSPEAKYPQAVEECSEVVAHIRATAPEWGIDPDDVSFAGDSGGANLSLATALHLRDHGTDPGAFRAMLLFYGAYGLKDSASIRLLGGPWDGLTESDWAWYRDLYLANAEDVDAPYFNLLSHDLSHGTPAAYIVGLELDPLRDDSRALADMLRSAGSPVEHVELPGVIHGFIHHSRIVSASMQMIVDACEYYRSRSA